MLRLRVYPDEFSIRRSLAPPTSNELDRLAEVVARMSAVPPLPEADAFASFASAVGASRALGLWRTHVVPDGGGSFKVLNLPFRMSGARVSAAKRMSTLGEHTRAYLKETGLSEDEIAAFAGKPAMAARG